MPPIIFWFIIPFLVGMFLHRWLLGLHWFNLLLDIPDMHGIIAGAIIGYIAFFIYLYFEYRNSLHLS